ncbi:fibronectin type III domain-containing protein [Chryseolinea soli]|uniref:Fibronectin type III domain-containing protein n=1 Tax=Chryseolinea soli TaxID=2321403 RepID=A0A385SQZ1_9BACT|nr:fibronectin type III domain-containing protein [Chryseolinea soli]AYB32375.1 fibronectin type III domain-containing protein [Chryseolinea soli]
MKKVIRVALNMYRLSDEALEVKVQSIIKNMTNNASFPGSIPELDAVSQAFTAFQVALVAQRTGTKRETAIKNDLRAALIVACRHLANVVDAKSNNDLGILLSSGFDARKEPTAAGRIEKPGGLQVTVGNLPGTVKVSIGKVANAVLFVYQYAPAPVTDQTEWKTLNSTTRTKTIINLEPGKQYAFRVGAAGPDPEVIYSDVVLRFVA